MKYIKEIENKNKIVIFDWGGVIESHKEGEYSIDRAIINLIKHFNSKEDEKNDSRKIPCSINRRYNISYLFRKR